MRNMHVYWCVSVCVCDNNPQRVAVIIIGLGKMIIQAW